jgi:hypothetical protein
MEPTRPKHAKWQTLKLKRRQRRLSKRERTSPPEILDHNESAQDEQIDRLLLSSLTFWEVERDLIEERMATMSR